MYQYLLLLISLFVSTQFLFAQKDSIIVHKDVPVREKTNSLKIGLGMTATNYRGDLSESEFAFNRFYPGINASLQGEGHRRIEGQFNLGVGTFAEQCGQRRYYIPAADSIHPNRFVTTSFIYGDVRIKAHLLNYHRMRPYISAGGGFLFYSPKDKKNLGLLDQEDTRLPDESYQLISLQAPISVGVDYQITRVLGLGLDYTYRFLTTDYIDNIGELGLKSGNDALQNVQITLYLTPNPSRYSMQAYTPPPKKNEVQKPDTVFINQELYDVIQDNKIKLPKEIEEPEEEDYFDMLNKGSEWEYEIEKGLKNKRDSIEFQKQILPDEDEVGADDYGWLWQKMVDKAIQKHKYISFIPNDGDNYIDIYEKYHVRPSVVRRLNLLGNSTEVPKDKVITIPDVREWSDLFPDVDAILKALEKE